MNPVYPPEGAPEATKLAWMQMTPKDRRKLFMLQEVERCAAITTVSERRAQLVPHRCVTFWDEVVGKTRGLHVGIFASHMPGSALTFAR